MGKLNSGPAESILFEYDTNLIGDHSLDTEYADPDDKENIWPEGKIRVNTARWMDSTLGFNHPDRPVQLEVFDGKTVTFHVINYVTPEEVTEDDNNNVMLKSFMDSPFYDIAILDRETGRYLDALDKTNEAFQAFRQSFDPELQREFETWRENKPEENQEPTNFTEPDRKSVWEVMSGATTEDLFKFKLDIFEQEVVQNSENRELRSKIRKAKSICEVCAAYQTLLDEEITEEEGSEE